jgi:GrpB-like predicted nucleotidyltransferase (UPF0157 family)
MSILIADYDPEWPVIFEAEARRLRSVLGELALRIDHVGSTAVAGLAAKPVIDIQISVATLDPIDPYKGRLESLGYSYATRPIRFFHRPADWPHTHHVHVCQAGGTDERRVLAFRDWLRQHPADRNAYEALKRELARNADAESVEGRSRYSIAKTDFIQEIESRFPSAA